MNSLTDGYSVCAGGIKMATLLWIYTVQHYQFKGVFVAISKNREHCLIQQLGYRVDELGILRYYGQFLNVGFNENAKYPKLLSRHNYEIYLLINHLGICMHNTCWNCSHFGPNT